MFLKWKHLIGQIWKGYFQWKYIVQHCYGKIFDIACLEDVMHLSD